MAGDERAGRVQAERIAGTKGPACIHHCIWGIARPSVWLECWYFAYLFIVIVLCGGGR